MKNIITVITLALVTMLGTVIPSWAGGQLVTEEESRNIRQLLDSAKVSQELTEALMKAVEKGSPELSISDGKQAYDYYFTKYGVGVGRIFPSAGRDAKTWKIDAMRDEKYQSYILTSFDQGDTVGLRISSDPGIALLKNFLLGALVGIFLTIIIKFLKK